MTVSDGHSLLEAPDATRADGDGAHGGVTPPAGDPAPTSQPPAAEAAEAGEAATYDPETFWEARLRSRFDLSGAGFRGIGKPFNEALYRQREIVFDRVLRRLALDPRQSRVVELGPGTGFYVELWKRHGVRSLLGLDITTVVTERLTAAYSSFAFAQADITEAWPAPDASADVVTALDVLFHIVDDVRFAAAIAECGRVLRPGGVLLVSDLFPRRAIRGHHHVSRTLLEYQVALARYGLDVVSRAPVFVTMHPAVAVPAALGGLSSRWWSWLERWLIEDPRRGHRMGRILGAIDRVLTWPLRGGPSTEVLIARKR